MEITVHPWRLERAGVARQYELILANFPHLQMAEVTRDVARRAAQLRAATGIRPADALQVATALVHRATAWVTNDKVLSRLGDMIDVIILDEYLDE
jgi:predicted nucleic acid-binding protein